MTIENSHFANTLIPEEFQSFITEAIENRKSKLIQKKKLEVKALPESVHLFRKQTIYHICIFSLLTANYRLTGKGTLFDKI